MKVGGKVLTHYDPAGRVGDPNTIENTILSFEPKRMFSIKATKPPEKFPFKEALKDMWTVLLFEPLGGNRTRVRDEWVQVRQYFASAWPSVLANLKRRFDPNSAAPKETPNVQ